MRPCSGYRSITIQDGWYSYLGAQDRRLRLSPGEKPEARAVVRSAAAEAVLAGGRSASTGASGDIKMNASGPARWRS